jgi:TatD DNase family protein
MIFDTHAHYDDKAFDADRSEVLSGLAARGVGAVTDAASTYESLSQIARIVREWPFVFGAYGIHPEEIGGVPESPEGSMKDPEGTGADSVKTAGGIYPGVGREMPDWLIDELRSYLRGTGAVAVGEIGLDYHWNKDDRERQILWFETQIEIAREEHLPVVIHSRDAAKDTMDTARRLRLGEVGGVMHCYSYSPEMAKEYLDMGLYLGVGGVVTFKNARRVKEVVKYAPLSSIVLETDCPYLAPEPHRGTRNDSGNLRYVARAVAEIKGISPDEVISATWENALKLYRIDRKDF